MAWLPLIWWFQLIPRLPSHQATMPTDGLKRKSQSTPAIAGATA